ncbi:MAG: ATP synthase F1 subunit alpha, F-type H+-transporting ATPase subunit alpha [Candidatus Peregrinibacteria bacterium GW2011_GWF2_39_17]|nr:MAG: ATP synthase F1 subunit alpha, F-type H+-transporting ATPase subunit alpha [Candidatus Peregrinibacteria bacterium GW2011_GWF2_39_17]HCW32670.1 F0F1 ATP synthase subunit alpha [Candidatus Peregrinibacteria bacterium]
MAQDTAILRTFLEDLESAIKKTQLGGDEKDLNQGIIQSYKDGVIQIQGLDGLRMNEVVTIEGIETQALVMNLEKDKVFALVLQPNDAIREGLFVKSTDLFLSIPVGEEIIGRVVDPLGTPLDGKGNYKAEKQMPLENEAPNVMVRKSVHQPVQTGIVAIDSLVPIGRGQRELIIGDRQTGKTTVAIDTIINQKKENMICIYVAVAQRESKTAQVIENLRANGAMDYTIIVSAPAASTAVLQYLAPYAGAAIAEYFMAKGKDVLVIYDDLSKHAVAYREMSLLLRRPPGREAYPGDVFYLHSRLLERAAKLNDKNGGGSITALPIIETQANDVSAYIPTNVISITDGQIFLESDLFNKGIRPAINVGISVSRVGGAAQTKIIKKVSGSVKLDLAQYYELEAFSQFASELDQTTKDKLTRGKRVVEALKQKQNNPYALWKEVVVLYIATNGYLDSITEIKVGEKIESLLALIESSHRDLVDEIQEKKEFSEKIETMLKEILNNFFK